MGLRRENEGFAVRASLPAGFSGVLVSFWLPSTVVSPMPIWKVKRIQGLFSVMVTEEDVREELKELMDPELDVNVVDLGLIYEIEVVDDRIEILMTLTTPACPMAGVFDEMVRQEVAHLEGINEVDVEITFDPKWTPNMISDDGRDKLGHMPGMQAF